MCVWTGRLAALFGFLAGCAVSASGEIDGSWPMPAKNYANTRYSELDQITAGNVKTLRVAWTFSTGVNRGQEAAPIVVGTTMYVVTPFPNIVYALDLAHAGAVKWKFEPKPEPAAQGVACCDYVNRGVAYADGRIFFNTLDCQTIALDAETGKQVWRAKLGDINTGETITMAPLVVRGKVLVGNSGGEFGVRGWLTALDAETGKQVWRAYSTGPDRDVLIGPDFKPFYPQDRGKDLGVSTWTPDQWKIGGGTVWGWISYDAESNTIFHGTGNPGPWNPEQRPGDNKWTCGVFARDPDTGAAKWFYQWSPHDLYDHDGVNECIVVDLPIGGATRKVIVHPGRNGYVYVLDRTTGEVISADGFVRINSSKGVDLKTGRLISNEEKAPKVGKVIRDIAPASPGSKDWEPSAYSPKTGWMYIPHLNLSMDFEGVEANYIAGTPYLGANVKMYGDASGNRGEFCAWDPVQRRKTWTIPEKFPVFSGTMATAGDVVFYGTLDGWFRAVDARNGHELWSFKTGSGIIGQPVTFLGPDGKQYVAVLSGIGGWIGAIVAGDLDPRDPTAGGGLANAVTDLKGKVDVGGTLYVFSLP